MSIRTRPNLLWRLLVGTGVSTVIVLSVNDDAWSRWESVVGDVVPRQRIRSLALGTGVLHGAEASVAFISARKAGVGHPLRWWFSTLLWGFPVLGRLRKAKKAARLAA